MSAGMYWSLHTHSKYSAKDALPEPRAIVARAAELEYPALGLTDHGNMAGTVEHYNECKKAGIKPLAGIEAYVAFDRSIRNVGATGKVGRIQTHHMLFFAYTTKGYRNLVRLNNVAVKNFFYTPIIDFGDLATLASQGLLEGVGATTGCWFGLVSKQLRESADPLASRNLIKALQGWFDGQVFVELQNHAIVDEEHDDGLHSRLLFDLATSVGAPMVLTQDSHYVRPSDQVMHNYMKSLISWSDDPDDAVFPGDGFHLVDSLWMKRHHEPEMYRAGMAGLNHLESIADMSIPELDTFSLVVPDVTGIGAEYSELVKQVEAGFQAKREFGEVKASQVKAMEQRLDEELTTIEEAGFAGYLLFSQKFADFMRETGIRFNIRGSAAGSAVVWMLGISQLNPITWKLSKDRFLSSDQTKPPDIDFDVEHTRRQECVAWLRSQFHVTNISTWMKMSVNKDDDESGSLLVSWKIRARKLGQDANRIPPLELAKLKALSDYKPYKGYGVHPAGLLVTPDEAAAAPIPLMYVASSKTTVTAYDMNAVEKMGRVKLDVLGLKTLSAITTMEKATGIEMYDVPLNDKGVYSMIGQGKTIGLFQLEGRAAMRGCRDLKPRNIHDIIAAMAIFRPAAFGSGATKEYINGRHGRNKRVERHPLITKETEDTFGVVVYQEQVLNIMKGIGLSVEEVERGRKAIKASNENVAEAKVIMAELIARVHELGKAEGMTLADRAFLEQALQAYADYGFNRAHATVYGIFAYITAWYRMKHPVAFWTGMLQAYTGYKPKGFDVEAHYRREARNDGVQLMRPHVNVSGAGYTLDYEKNAIRLGLTAIKGLGAVAAAELERHAPYDTLDELARKVAAKRVTGSKDLGAGHPPASCPGTINMLEKAGALHGLEREKTTTTKE